MDLPRVRLDGGARAFRQRWGYEGGAPPAQPPTLLEEDEDDEEAETVSLRDHVLPACHSPLGKYRTILRRTMYVYCSEVKNGRVAKW